MEKILLVDDDVELCELIGEYLAPEGFVVETRHDGAQGLETARRGHFGLLILDVMLPKMGGFEVLRQLRATPENSAENAALSVSIAAEKRLPVLMLTARGDDVDRIVGLEMGADDYLPKPFNPRELSARIRAILRRTQTASISENATISSTRNAENADSNAEIARAVLRVGDMEMDEGARRVLRYNSENEKKNASFERVELTSVEFDLLAMLLRSAGQVVARDAMTQQVLGRKPLRYDRSIDTHISNLRKKLGSLPDGAERITSIRSVGYIYVLPAR